MDGSGRVADVARAFNVVGFAGSLRRGSYNRALLRAAVELAPSTLRIAIHELDDIRLYNGDVEAAGVPPSVVHLRDSIRMADALLIATPEYNHGVPGVLKNTIDWLSRPPRNNALNGRLIAKKVLAELGLLRHVDFLMVAETRWTSFTCESFVLLC